MDKWDGAIDWQSDDESVAFPRPSNRVLLPKGTRMLVRRSPEDAGQVFVITDARVSDDKLSNVYDVELVR